MPKAAIIQILTNGHSGATLRNGDAMTYRQMFEKELGQKKFKQLSAAWRRHIRRIDNLPKPKKKLSTDKILDLVGA